MVVHSIDEDQTFVENEKIFDNVLPDSEVIWHSLIMPSEDIKNPNHLKVFLACREGETYNCVLALLGENQVMVLGMKNALQQYLIEEILKINAMLTNKFRRLYKEKTDIKLDTYDEISKMNNDLANARRELKKKNFKLEELNLQLEHLSTKDVLTDLFNRRYFYSFTHDVALRAKRLKVACSLIMIDVNNFKKVNDNFGHDSGDKLLIHLSTCLKNTFRRGQDTLFRFGGDEFIVLLEASTYEDSFFAMQRLNNLYEKDSKGTSLAAGIIEISYEEIQDDFTEFIKKADLLMYAEKEKNRRLFV